MAYTSRCFLQTIPVITDKERDVFGAKIMAGKKILFNLGLEIILSDITKYEWIGTIVRKYALFNNGKTNHDSEVSRYIMYG